MANDGDKYNSAWIDEVRDSQELVALSNEDISTINDQWEHVLQLTAEGDVDNEQLVGVVRGGLSEQQGAAVQSLLEISKNVPYEEMADFLRYFETRVAEIKAKLADKAVQFSKEEEHLYYQRDKLAAVVPSLSDTLGEVAASEASKLKMMELVAAEDELDNAESNLDAATALFMETGEAWPVPRLAAVESEPIADEIVIIDEFPYEREQRSETIAERIRTRQADKGIRLNDASHYLALHLVDEPGHIWTSSELGKAIYPDEENERDRTGRVASLISNYRLGKTARMTEHFDGRVLQRGRRRMYNLETGDPILRSSRVVWRVVDEEIAQTAQTITTINEREGTRQSYDEWQSIIPGTELSDDREEVRAEAPDLEGVEDVQAAEQVESAAAEISAVSADKENGKEDWKQEFTKEVHRTIDRFEELGLMESEAISWKMFAVKTPSAITGTKEMRERALSKKIIKRSQLTDDNAEITIVQAIVCDMLNSHKNIFDVSSRKKVAIRIIEEVVNGYFDRINRNQA